MKISTIELKKITASDGMVLTNGETFSSVGGCVYLGANDSAENWREITEEQYNKIVEQMEKEID